MGGQAVCGILSVLFLDGGLWECMLFLNTGFINVKIVW
jgi:hypothetical protein